VAMLVVFGIHFSTLISENCLLILSSQMFPPDSSSQFFKNGEILTPRPRATDNQVGLA